MHVLKGWNQDSSWSMGVGREDVKPVSDRTGGDGYALSATGTALQEGPLESGRIEYGIMLISTPCDQAEIQVWGPRAITLGRCQI